MTTSYETDAVEKVCTYLILFIYYLNLLVLFYTLNTHNLNVLEFDLISIIINQRVMVTIFVKEKIRPTVLNWGLTRDLKFNTEIYWENV